MTAKALIYLGLKYRLDSKDRYLIWFTQNPNADSIDDSDGVVIDENGAVLIFNSPIELTQYAKVNGYTPVEMEKPRLHNLDVIANWLKLKKRKRRQKVDCVEFLNAWNLFGDVSRSLNGDFDAEQNLTQKIYTKLFWGNNLPSMTPIGESYSPSWSVSELEIIHEIMSHGLFLFRNHLKKHKAN